MNKFAKIVLATAMGGLMSTGAMAADFTLKIAAGSPSKGNVCTGYLDVWGEKIKAASNGRIDYKLYCDNTLVKFGDAVTRVEAGIADVAWALPGAYGARFGGINVVGVPGLYEDSAYGSGALWKAFEAGELGPVEGVKVLWFQAVPNNSFWLKKAPASHTSLDGLKIGMGSAIRAAVIENAGGVPVSLKVPEYYQAVAKGSVDGVMTTGGAIEANSIQEITDYYMEGPFGAGVTFTVMNQALYDSMPADLQKVIDDNSGYETSVWAAEYLRDYEAKSMTKFLERAGTERYVLTEEELASWQPHFEAAAKSWLDATPNGAEILAAFKARIAAEKAK